MVGIFKGTGREENSLFFALSDGTIVGGTGITATEKLWNTIPVQRDAFYEIEWIDKAKKTRTEQPDFFVSGTEMQAETGPFRLVQGFSAVSENRIRVEVQCDVLDTNILLSLSLIHIFCSGKIHFPQRCCLSAQKTM